MVVQWPTRLDTAIRDMHMGKALRADVQPWTGTVKEGTEDGGVAQATSRMRQQMGVCRAREAQSPRV